LEARILLAIHEGSNPLLDVLFVISHVLGTMPFCVLLVTISLARHLRRGERTEATFWLVVGLSTFFLQEWLKVAVGRLRPTLWTPLLIPLTTKSFPSGHALAAATFYPLLANDWARTRPHQATLAYAISVAIAFYIGFGRLYLGVHWPSDVLAGWAIGAAQAIVGIRLRRRWRRAPKGGPAVPS
jgi:undecaprenyl-diphosphatase